MTRSGVREWRESHQTVFRRGTYRTSTPKDTIASVHPLLPLFGITRIANVTGLDRIGIPVSSVTRPNSRSVSVSQGKGLEWDAAVASGVMESIECYHAEHIVRPVIFATYEEVRYTRNVIDISLLAHRKDSRLTGDTALLWIEAIDLATERGVWVPYEAVSLNHTYPPPPGAGTFDSSSSGLASGNTYAEAILHGLCELIERDSTACWILRGRSHWKETKIDINSITDPDCCELLSRVSDAGCMVGVWETTSDIGIPSFTVLLADKDLDTGLMPFLGFGCHPQRSIALSRALTEAAQARLTVIVGARDDLSHKIYARHNHVDAGRRNQELLDEQGRRLFETDQIGTEDVVECVATVLRGLTAAGIQDIVVVDLGDPILRIPVVRVLAPKLEPQDTVEVYRPGLRAIHAAGVEP